MEQNLIKSEPLGCGHYIYVSHHHNFGTDAILLADFARPKNKDRIVDLGTGCGIIPMLMHRHTDFKSAVGVDISKEACRLAVRSVNEQNIDNISVVCSNLTELKGKVEFGINTLVTCNPPYKKNGAGLQNPDSVCRTARHEIACTLEDIVGVSAKLLQTSGRLCMCHRPERLTDLICLMRQYKIEPKRLRTVAQRKGESPWLVLVEGRRCGNSGLTVEPQLYIEENGEFSDEMIKIYGSYKEAFLK